MDHHHKIQVLNMLSSAVFQLDLTDQKPKKKNPLQINELLNMILAKLKVQNLLHLRSVCSHWKSMIEAICGQKQCLRLYNVLQRNRFYDTIEIGQLVSLRLKRNKLYITPFENDCATSLGKLFPNVTQLVISVYLDEDAAMNLFDMIEKYWPSLNTLSVKEFASDIIDICCDRISELKCLKRLNLWGDLKCVPTPKIFNQLEQFSCYDFGSNKILTKLPPLGPNCTRFWYGCRLDGYLPASAIDRWIQRNSAQVLGKLTHLHLSWVHDNTDNPLAIRLICENFPSLKVFKFKYSGSTQFNSATCAQLSKLSHLNKLSIGSALLNLDSLGKNSEQSQLLSIRVFHLNELEIFHPFDANSPDCERFCRTLASIVPNVEELGIDLMRNSITHAMIQDHLRCFRKLRKYTDLASLVVKLK